MSRNLFWKRAPQAEGLQAEAPRPKEAVEPEEALAGWITLMLSVVCLGLGYGLKQAIAAAQLSYAAYVMGLPFLVFISCLVAVWAALALEPRWAVASRKQGWVRKGTTMDIARLGGALWWRLFIASAAVSVLLLPVRPASSFMDPNDMAFSILRFSIFVLANYLCARWLIRYPLGARKFVLQG